MKIGLQIANVSWSGGAVRMATTLRDLVTSAEEAGFDAIGVADHVWQSPYMGGPEQPQLECLTTLGIVAAHTRRARLTPLVLAATYRPAAIIAKGIATLDVLSGGRAMLGLGAGHYEAEARGMGLPFPPLADRYAALEETLQVCLRLWSGEQGDEQSFAGQHVQMERALNLPQSLTRPHPPILVGGSGERKTLRLVARYADACGLYPLPDLSHKLDVLRRHCDEVGRDYDTIEKTCTTHFRIGVDGSTAADAIASLRDLANQGIETVFGIVAGSEPVRMVEIVGREVIPAVMED